MRRALVAAALVAAALAVVPTRAAAEAHFALSNQYTRCTTCHYSPTGGGLLTAYGRALSKQEVSTWGRTAPGSEPEGWREEAPFYDAFGDRLGALDLGLDLRPARIEYDIAGTKRNREFWMRADLEAAYRTGEWTFYGEFGRKPAQGGDPVKWTSWEYWVAWQGESGVGVRAGRFLPAYGIRNADHTNYTRRDLGLDVDAQVLGVELGHTGEKHLYQFSLSPGTADSWLRDEAKGDRRFIATARLQWDLGAKNVLALSGAYRGDSDFDPVSWYGGVAHGWSPHPRLAFWTELDERVAKGWEGTPEYTLLHEASVQVHRGVWLKFTPQIQTALNNVSGGKTRFAVTAQLFPRPHWNLNATWTRDRDRVSGFVVKTLLLQLHLYL